jgi:hypothetical protein
MSKAMTFPMRQTNQQAHSGLNLPGPRIWKPKHLAEFFGFSVHWVYKITKSTSEDPPPRCQGIGRLAWDTQSQAFQQWIIRRLRTIDDQEQDNV